MTKSGYQYVYGPVPSRRLGRSLGIDLVPFKTCSYDCIYCQLGRTTNHTTKFDEYVPLNNVISEIRNKLKTEPRPDFISLAGSGEPTLHSRLKKIVDEIKTLTDVPIAVITNGSLLWNSEVRTGLSNADLVIPSLDAGTPESFLRVNHPHPDISFEQMVDGLLTFSHAFKGEIWLEVLLLGITNQPKEIMKIAAIAKKMRINRVQLNTAERPTAAASALAVPKADLENLKGLFSCPCEVIAQSPRIETIHSCDRDNIDNRITALLCRRPCTVKGISDGLGLCPNDVLKHLDVLNAKGEVRTKRKGEDLFYEGVRNRS